jgi:hypothetical protein
VYSAVAAVALVLVPHGARALDLTGLSVNGGAPVPAGSPAPVVCLAVATGTLFKDVPTSASFSAAVAGSPAGAFTPATSAFTGPDASGTYAASSSWTAPVTPGVVTVTCSGTGSRSGTATRSVDVTVAAPPAAAPQITAFTGPPSSAFTGTTYEVSATADDPAATYAWTATGGTFTDPAAPTTRWIAPETQGTYSVTVTVTGAGGSTPRSASVSTALALYQGALPAALRYPRRAAATPDGELLVVDDLGNLMLLTKRGELRGSIPGLGATSVTVGGGAAFVATRSRGIVKVDPLTGRQIGAIRWASSSNITGMAFDGARQLLWVAAYEARRVIALKMDGTQAREIVSADGRALRALGDVALDVARDTLWVAEKDGSTGHLLHAFAAADGTWLRSMITPGTGTGQVVETGGIAIDPAGRVFVSDAFGGAVQVMTSAGTFVATVGSKGDVDGYLLQPRGLAFLANGDLAIANSWFNRIARFGTGVALPACEGDADCDGLPDAWEDANFGAAARNDPANAMLDSDGDGLTNREELALGTNPNAADTDGDGFSDRAEVLAGSDPLNGGDHLPAVVAGDLGQVPPGVVRLNATSSNTAACTPSWRQTTGPKVTLRDADTFSPSFVARAAGAYAFEAVAVCAGTSSAPAVSRVEVVNVAPLADAGRVLVTSPGHTVTINAGFSSDPNGDTLAFSWAQRVGPATSVTSRGAMLSVRPPRAGYYEYALMARDRAGATATRTVGVVVVDDALPTAVVSNPVVTAAVGGSVTLDASASLPADAAFAWRLVEPEGGVVATTPTASVAVPAAGRYVYEVTAMKGGVSSPPARVVVLAGEGGALPSAVASAPEVAGVNAEVTLDGSASGGGTGLVHSWRQVSGPAAGLAHADSPVATAVPFAPGVHVFELTVSDGTGAVGAPATVRIDVASAGQPLPVANVIAPASAAVGELVILNGRGSTSASRFRWSQVAGPWVALDCASATPTFVAPAAGAYVFELVVDDGRVRSAPATVAVDVQ